MKDLCVPAIIGAQFLRQYTIYVSEQFTSIILRKPCEDDNGFDNKKLNIESTYTEAFDENRGLIECKVKPHYKDLVLQKHSEYKLSNEKSCQTECIEEYIEERNNNEKGCQTDKIEDTYLDLTDKHIGISVGNEQDDFDSTEQELNSYEEVSADYLNDDVKLYTEAVDDDDIDFRQDYSLVENRNLSELKGVERISKVIDSLNMKHLEQHNYKVMEAIMSEYSDVFYLKGDKLSITDAAIHNIETTTNIPINKRQYRFPESTKKLINEEIEEMYRQGIIRPSTSPWNAPVLCIPKKDLDADGNKKYRIVIDFRELNLITKPFVYPIPLIDEILDSLGHSKYFTTVDLKSGFYQVPINPKDAAKTAFSTPKGHYEFTRMPMGLRNSPSTFQRLMNTVLYELGDIQAIVYLDDIIVYGRTIEEHNRELVRVLKALRKHNLKIESIKCQVLRTEINYLGHTVDQKGIRPTKDNITAVRNMPVPKTVKGVRSFLGTVNFYGKFIPKIAEIRKPLNELLKKNVRFIWTNECQIAFEKLRDFLTSDSLLVRPNYKDTFVLTTDASDYAIGAVLSNEKLQQ